MTLYAGFTNTDNDLVETTLTEKYEENCKPDIKIVFSSDKKLTEKQFLESVTIEALSGELPEEFNVLIEGNDYILYPTDGYTPGKLYSVSVSNGIRFKNFDSTIKKL